MQTSERSYIPDPPDFLKAANLRPAAKLTWIVAKTIAIHPSLVFQNPFRTLHFTSEESDAKLEAKREKIEDRVFVAMAAYLLESEAGSEAYRTRLIDHVIELRNEYELPSSIPIQNMRELM